MTLTDKHKLIKIRDKLNTIETIYYPVGKSNIFKGAMKDIEKLINKD